MQHDRKLNEVAEGATTRPIKSVFRQASSVRIPFVVALLMVAAATLAGPGATRAGAQERELSPEDDQRARTHFESGRS